MRRSYETSRIRLRFNAFSRVLRSAYHDTLFPSIDGRQRRVVHHLPGSEGGADSYEIHEYRGRLKICPGSGLVFDDNVLLKNSTDLYMRERVPRYRTVYDGEGRHFPDLISLRHGSEPNYWHYFQLVATKAVIADLHGLAERIPLLLSRRQAEVPFIKRSLELNLYRDRPVVIQEEDEVIATDRLYTIRPPLHGRTYRDRVLDRLGHASDPASSDRLFVTRGKSAENDRRLQNEDAVTDALAAFGFRTIDPQTLSLDKQIETFSKCGFMVSPHGAGLTNMIFRRGAPLDVVEIFNFNLVNPCYEIVASDYGFGYRALYCENVVGKPKSGNALVEIHALTDAVEAMLARSGGG